ncbi:MAG: DUF885 domain-containing protein [Acidobacteriota bacterium]
MRKRIASAAVLMALVLAGCAEQKPQTTAVDFNKLVDDFVYGSLALSPVSATGAGYHAHNGKSLDEALDDYGAYGIEATRKFYTGFASRLDGLNPATLDKEQLADVAIMRNNIQLSLLDLNEIQTYKHSPQSYAELVGNALYTPYVLNYAPKEQRFGHIISRLRQVPALMLQAKANLVDAPEVWNRVAREENSGNIDLIDQLLRKETPDAQKAEYALVAAPALAALREFTTYLEKELSKKTSDWRLGKEKYAKKFEWTLAIGKTPEQLLASAEADLKATREKMAALAAPRSVKEALDEIAKQHSTPATYMPDAKKTLEQASAFVKQKDLVTLPAQSNLQVIETPAFMRGIYGVGGFNSAPPLQPELGAFYWVTPIPSTWSKDRVDSKLREYNSFGLQHLTVHEAMPGHYVQLEVANSIEPKSRRVLRSVFGNGPYIEGWAFYTQQMMTEEGYMDNAVGMRMTLYKQILRALANAILDIRLQTMGMTDQQALDLMINDTYQEKEEATAKLQRAQLSSSQLPMYYSGWKAWLELREKDKQRKGAAFSLKGFHDRALKESAVPMPVLDGLLQ